MPDLVLQEAEVVPDHQEVAVDRENQDPAHREVAVEVDPKVRVLDLREAEGNEKN